MPGYTRVCTHAKTASDTLLYYYKLFFCNSCVGLITSAVITLFVAREIYVSLHKYLTFKVGLFSP